MNCMLNWRIEAEYKMYVIVIFRSPNELLWMLGSCASLCIPNKIYGYCFSLHKNHFFFPEELEHVTATHQTLLAVNHLRFLTSSLNLVQPVSFWLPQIIFMCTRLAVIMHRRALRYCLSFKRLWVEFLTARLVKMQSPRSLKSMWTAERASCHSSYIPISSWS